ncbi:GAF domain-containing sensor histidine kinase [Pseudonocardia sp. DSM 110487]|uniref:sensor histidine kinase n=1 Tax=Pseudonocardia sp. DSM 110487 TaxID=2865833 RepID=UPI001C6A6C40|nr:GAF domain-containing sensor histidine kinase [Pseudonocardia sp. DSM 110487]QYN34750.1 GAF domain-containing sensor histidine kinase [Pseudonocardia sp. DSM 110487]
MSIPPGWSAQKLAEFLAAVSSFATESAAAAGAVERVAESLDAEVVAIVSRGASVTAIGYPEGATPVAELAAVAGGQRAELTVPGSGSCPAAVVPLEHPPGARLVVARSGPDPLSTDELGLLHAMARVTSMTLRMRRYIDDERALRKESQRQSAENAHLLATLTDHQVLLERLADEQAALRRVATLVARQPAASAVLASVTEEVGRLLNAGFTQMLRYEGREMATAVAGWLDPDVRGREIPVGTRLPATGALAGHVLQQRTSTRMNSTSLLTGGPIADHVRGCGLRSATASPIEVEGRLWGVMIAGWPAPEPPVDAESRIAEFAQLVATSISNAQARAEVVRLAAEQAALRRVATLVAKGEKPAVIFTRVAEEIARISHVDNGFVLRFEPDDTLTVVASSGRVEVPMQVGSNWPLDGDSVAARVFHTGRPARMDSYHGASGPIADAIPSADFAAVGAPIVIGDRLWGAATAMTAPSPDTPTEPEAIRPAGLPVEAEDRIAKFADLVAIAISNADAREQLTASRARVVAASDEARRRFERNLHDGVQQGLVSLALTLREAESMAPPDTPELHAAIGRVVDGLNGVLEELREISRGLHPAILSEGGLAYALRSLARRSAVPTTLNVRVPGRLPERVEVPAYYVVSEALTNAAKHAQASVVDIDVDATNGIARIVVRDDGIGGAEIGQGSGLIGLVDRVEAAGGEFTITSPPGEGTSLLATFPLAQQ